MKGGKQGRQRRPSGTAAKGKAGSRGGGGVKSGSANRPASDAPKKGERVKSYGGRSSREA